jgi:NADH-quinone oxidoreductase subunit M
MLIPMFFIIGIWGGEKRIYATIKFFLYTAFGSILMLVAIIWLLQSFVFSGTTPSLEFSELYKLKIHKIG